MAKRRVEPQDITAAQELTGAATRADVRFVERGRAYDPASRRKYKDGFAPWQLFARQQAEWDRIAAEAGE